MIERKMSFTRLFYDILMGEKATKYRMQLWNSELMVKAKKDRYT